MNPDPKQLVAAAFYFLSVLLRDQYTKAGYDPQELAAQAKKVADEIDQHLLKFPTAEQFRDL